VATRDDHAQHQLAISRKLARVSNHRAIITAVIVCNFYRKYSCFSRGNLSATQR
jgi:hypothetical protein